MSISFDSFTQITSLRVFVGRRVYFINIWRGKNEHFGRITKDYTNFQHNNAFFYRIWSQKDRIKRINENVKNINSLSGAVKRSLLLSI